MRLYGLYALVAFISLIPFQPLHAATYTRGHAVDNLHLPNTNAEASNFAIDLDGDAHADNLFGSVLVLMPDAFGLDIDAATEAEVAAGQIVHLIGLRSSDAVFASDPAAEATWYVGEATPAPPLFDGSDTFHYDAAFAPGEFVSALTGSNFVSANPATANASTDLTVQIRIGSYTIALPMQGSRLKFTATPSGLSQGQVNGSIRKTDIDAIFVPALAATFNDVVQADPKSDTAMSLLQLFDSNPIDGAISVEEVATNDLMTTILAPDLDIRDENGNYSPNPANTSNDALSFGFGFTAVASQTILPLIFEDSFEE